MKRWMAGILAVALLFLSGCSYTQTGIDALLRPPLLSDQQEEIYRAITASAGENIRLIYPRTGGYTSAFLIENIDSEPTEEAIVFYQQTTGSSASMRINVLDQRNGGWYSLYDIAGAPGATEIEKVDFMTIEGQRYVAVGFNLTGSRDKMCTLYAYNEGRLTEKQRWGCTNYVVFDLNDDGADEILTITTRRDAAGIRSSVADLRRMTNTGGSQTISSVELDPGVSEYIYITPGRLSDGRSALYLDGVRGSSVYTTEILACEGQRMVNLIYNSTGDNLIDQTSRPSGMPSVDLTGEGIVEIPLRVSAPGYESDTHQQEYFTRWYVYEEGQLRQARTTYAAYSLGYLFTIPDSWLDKVTVAFDANTSELFFYSYSLTGQLTQGGTKQELDDDITFYTPQQIAELGTRFLSIKVVKAADAQEEIEDNGYQRLEENGQIVYLYQIYSSGDPVPIDSALVKELFQLYPFS